MKVAEDEVRSKLIYLRSAVTSLNYLLDTFIFAITSFSSFYELYEYLTASQYRYVEYQLMNSVSRKSLSLVYLASYVDIPW